MEIVSSVLCSSFCTSVVSFSLTFSSRFGASFRLPYFYFKCKGSDNVKYILKKDIVLERRTEGSKSKNQSEYVHG